LRRAIARLVRAFAPERIVLFGSHAKGVAQPGSDVDMLIVADSYVARQLVADNFPPVDVALCSTSRSNIVAARACRCRVLSYRERDDRYTIAARGSREATIDIERGTSSMR
jgi:predicted nucleotidyltransferase